MSKTTISGVTYIRLRLEEVSSQGGIPYVLIRVLHPDTIDDPKLLFLGDELEIEKKFVTESI